MVDFQRNYRFPLRTFICIITAGLIFLLFTIIQSFSSPLAAQEVVYVDESASGDNDGTSWENAYLYLQDAIDEANVDASTEYEIRIAQGVYYPDEDEVDQIEGIFEPETGDHIADDRSEAFIIARDSVILRGGYPAGGGERDVQEHLTVLSGDITQDDETNEDGVTETAADQTGDNSYHVITVGENILEIPGSGGSHTNSTRFDGLRITAGLADGSSTDDQRGGGIYNDQSDPVLIEITFSGNVAEILGGGMYNTGNPVLINSTFAGNQAGTEDGTLSGSGGGLYNNGDFGESTPVIINTVFTGNSTTGSGGALYNSGVNEGESSPTIIGATFFGNTAMEQFGCGGAIVNNANADGTSETELTNTILWGNSAEGEGDEICNIAAGSQLSVSHSILEGGAGTINESDGSSTTEGDVVLSQDPLFVDATGSDGTAGTSDDNLNLQNNSPAVDAGNTEALPPDDFDLDTDGDTTDPLPMDRAGSERTQGNHVDIGAFESAGDGVSELTATTDDPTNITESGAQLNGRVNPGGSETTVVFEYYATAEPDQTMSIEAEQSPLSGSDEHEVSATLTDLQSGTEYSYYLIAENNEGSSTGLEQTFTTEEATSLDPDNGEIPEQFTLRQNYPNPFNPSTDISYGLPEDVDVTLEVFDLSGRHVATLVENEHQQAGWHELTFDASHLSSGIYIYRLETSEIIESKKLTLIK